MSSGDKAKGADETPVPVKTIAQRLKHVAPIAMPALDDVRARVADLNARVDNKLAGVPDERRQPAPAHIAAPAALQYALLGQGEGVAELREMFENLLVASMDSDTASSAHPAFVSMIQQLTPDEARILKSINRNEYPYTDLRRSGSFRTTLGIDAEIDGTRQQQYVSNLERLGILRMVPVDTLTGSGGVLVVTPLGRQFLDTCVCVRAR
jgi:hypothetical protein